MAVESNLYQAFTKNRFRISDAYKDKFRTLALNIKEDKNTEIRIKILFDIITPKQLCTMEEADLMTSKDKKALKQQRA